MEDNSELIKVLFMALVDELGGIVKLDAVKIAKDIKQNKFKNIGVSVENNVVIVEVFDEGEN